MPPDHHHEEDLPEQLEQQQQQLIDVLLQRGPAGLPADDTAHRAVEYCAYPPNDVTIAVIVLGDGRTITYDSARPGRAADVFYTAADGTTVAYHDGPDRPT